MGAQQIGAIAGFIHRDADVLVEHVHLELGQVQALGGDEAVKRQRRVSRGDHQVMESGLDEPFAQQLGGGVISVDAVIESAEVHG